MSESSHSTVFIAAAGRYCALIEACEACPIGPLLREIEQMLAELYAAALRLPEVELSDEHTFKGGISYDQWVEMYRKLQAVLGPCDLYRQIYDPAALGDPGGAIAEGNEPVISSLADDLADIWHDVRPGLDAWTTASATQRSHILWEWQFFFDSHWGQHLADALRVVHWWLHVHRIGEEDEGPDDA